MDVQLISKQAESITKQQHHFESNLLAQTIMRLLVTGLSAPGWQQTALWTPPPQPVERQSAGHDAQSALRSCQRKHL
jgi:hypothetical protein